MNNVYEVQIGRTLLKMVEGDITRQKTFIIVNATNSRLQPGGGVDHAIHIAAGPTVLAELRKKYTECLPGEIVITDAGNLAKQGVKKIFHTVGPIWRGGDFFEQQTLASCYINCLHAAYQNYLESIAIPAICTGVYGDPIKGAASIAINTVFKHISGSLLDVFTEVIFVLFTADDFIIYKNILEKLLDSTKFSVSKF